MINIEKLSYDELKIIVKELLDENGYLRNLLSKQATYISDLEEDYKAYYEQQDVYIEYLECECEL